MSPRWVQVAAEVEWYEGHRGQERPIAVRFGAERLELTVERGWNVGPAEAGRPERRIFLARAADGRRLRIRLDGQGAAGVETEVAD